MQGAKIYCLDIEKLMLLSRKLLAGFLFIFPNIATNVNLVSLKGNLITSTKFGKRIKKC